MLLPHSFIGPTLVILLSLLTSQAHTLQKRSSAHYIKGLILEHDDTWYCKQIVQFQTYKTTKTKYSTLSQPTKTKRVSTTTNYRTSIITPGTTTIPSTTTTTSTTKFTVLTTETPLTTVTTQTTTTGGASYAYSYAKPVYRRSKSKPSYLKPYSHTQIKAACQLLASNTKPTKTKWLAKTKTIRPTTSVTKTSWVKTTTTLPTPTFVDVSTEVVESVVGTTTTEIAPEETVVTTEIQFVPGPVLGCPSVDWPSVYTDQSSPTPYTVSTAFVQTRDQCCMACQQSTDCAIWFFRGSSCLFIERQFSTNRVAYKAAPSDGNAPRKRSVRSDISLAQRTTLDLEKRAVTAKCPRGDGTHITLRQESGAFQAGKGPCFGAATLI